MPNTSNSFTHTTGSQLRVGDADLYHESQGDPTKPLLLLLHGGLGSIADFNPFVGPLSRDFHLVGLDTRGHGKSSLGSSPLTYEVCEADVIALLQHMGVETFSILGLSDGGIVGYRLAASHAARVTSLVTVGSQWRLSPTDPAYDLLSDLTPEMWDEMFPASRAYYESVNPAPDFSHLVKSAVALWTDLRSSSYPGDRIQCITAPTLVVRGDSDPLFSLAEAVDLQAMLPGASFFNVPFAGHEVHVDSPQLFSEAARDFLLHPRRRATEG